jgi:hypothetical protein
MCQWRILSGQKSGILGILCLSTQKSCQWEIFSESRNRKNQQPLSGDFSPLFLGVLFRTA